MGKKIIGFIIMTDSGPIFIDEQGEFWLGGSQSTVKVALFKDKYEAHKKRNLMRSKSWFKENVAWTKIYGVFNVA